MVLFIKALRASATPKDSALHPKVALSCGDNEVPRFACEAIECTSTDSKTCVPLVLVLGFMINKTDVVPPATKV